MLDNFTFESDVANSFLTILLRGSLKGNKVNEMVFKVCMFNNVKITIDTPYLFF